MKYTYVYKTSDGVRHEETTEAKSREEVFSALRAKGIKAIKVVAADGSKANGEVRGVRKRIVALIAVMAALGSVIVVLSVVGLDKNEQAQRIDTDNRMVVTLTADPLPRQPLQGSRSRIEADPSSFLADAAEAYLVRFAEPGRPLPADDKPRPSDEDFLSSLKRKIEYTNEDFTEQIDLKRIVAGLKSEMASYIQRGGTVGDYIEELVKRQKVEASYRDRAEKHLNEMMSAKARNDKSAFDYWLKANAQLQAMGIYPLPLPRKLREYQMSIDIEE